MAFAKKLFGFLLIFAAVSAHAQFNKGQILTASGLNAALAAPTITGGSINGAPIGQTTPAAGSFTTLSASGNMTTGGQIGISSTLNPWSVLYALQIGSQGYFYSDNGSSETGLGNNAYYNSGWKYSKTGSAATRYSVGIGGTHRWYYAPSGTAGNAITWSQSMMIDASGNLLKGVTTARSNYFGGGFTPAMQLEGSDVASSTLTLTQNASSSSGGGVLGLGATRSATVSGNTVMQSGDRVGSIVFDGADGANLINAAAIRAFVDGTPGTNAMPGRLVFETTKSGASSSTEAMRIDSSQNLLVGVTNGSSHVLSKAVAEGAEIARVSSSTTGVASVYIDGASGTGESSSASVLFVRKNSSTGRSINAAGTINASGADYAEYMRKAPGVGELAKGQIVGVDSDGNLTDRYSAAVSFLIVSTDPSYIGGDTWGSEQAIGMAHPTQPASDSSAADRAKYLTDKAKFDGLLALAQNRVAIIAYAGQVPVNVKDGKPGQYVIPVRGKGDTIAGRFVDAAALTFQQYRTAVGVVQNLLPDGRANVRVKVL